MSKNPLESNVTMVSSASLEEATSESLAMPDPITEEELEAILAANKLQKDA